MANKEEKWKISRRSFLLASGAAVAAGAAGNFLLSGCQPEVKVEKPVEEEPAPERKVVSVDPEITETRFNVCGVCSANCAMICDIADGKVWRIRGNPDDQVARGHLCVKGYASYRTLYDPDRLKYPMKRTNPEKGPGVDPGWVKISWEEAFELTAQKFNEVKEKYGPEAIVFFTRPHDFAVRLAKAIGTPNLVRHHDTCYTTHEATWRVAVTGSGRPWMLDIYNAKYILSFGWDQPSKAKNMSAQGYIHALSNGAKAVVFNPLLTPTAALADEWIPIKPGTDLAVCLAMIHVIINEDLYDKEFVENYTEGFDQLKSFIQEYTPAWAEEISEVPADTIVRIAREFATTKPAIVPNHKRDAGGPLYANSWRTSYAFIILNALVGSIDREGGVVFQRRAALPKFDEVFPPPEFPPARKETIMGTEKFPIIGPTGKLGFVTITDAILNEKPYPVKAMFVRKQNVLAVPDASRFVEALKKLDFVAVADILPTEIVQMADVVFPEPHFLESSGIVERVYFAYYPQIALREPAVETLYDTKGYGSIIIGIAKAMGLGDYFEGVSSTKLAEEQLKSLGTSMEELKANNGLWSDVKPFKPREEFNTPSKKIELYSSVLKEHGYDPLPSWQPKREEPDDEYPFYLVVTRYAAHRMTESQNNELAMQVAPENYATINKQVAQQLGIKDGDEVIVASRVNEIKLKAKVIEGIRPDCICIEHGFGHWSRELSIAYGVGANDGDLIPGLSVEELIAAKDPSASGYMSDVCVKIARA